VQSRTDIQAAFERDKSATAPAISTAAGCLRRAGLNRCSSAL
jgi:hypothetical protein